MGSFKKRKEKKSKKEKGRKNATCKKNGGKRNLEITLLVFREYLVGVKKESTIGGDVRANTGII